jgi:glucose/arabinose dehydrogenase
MNESSSAAFLRRRRFLQSGLAVGLASIAGCAATDGPDDSDTDGSTGYGTDSASTGGSTPSTRIPTPADADGPRPDLESARVGVERVASGFSAPLDFVAPAGTDRQFVVDRIGVVSELTDAGRSDTPLLDLSDRVVLGGERGLLGVAAHPEFADTGRLYVRYSTSPGGGTPDNYSHTAVLAEVTVDPEADAADDFTERTLLAVPQPQSNHNAGALAFGPDGYLYVAFGDGGGANDVGTGHVDDWYDAVAGGNGQDLTENLLGSILRIDVDERGGVDGSGNDKLYGIPESNPLVGREGLSEQYAWGFRNPWRLSFAGSDLYAADVGQDAWEELNIVERGGNYGWNVREGAHCFREDTCPATTPTGEQFVDPVAEYAHDGDLGGVSIIGGYVAESDAMPDLQGAYVFADYVARGRLFAVDPGATPPWEIETLPVAGETDLGRYVLGFGRGQAGDLYVLTTDDPGGEGDDGQVFRISEP